MVAYRAAVARIAGFLLGVFCFVLGWWSVFAREEVSFTVLVWMALGLIGIVAVTFAWIRWNLRIHAVKGPRRGVRISDPWPDVDQIGRRVRQSPEIAGFAHVRVSVVDGEVVFEADEVQHA